ncbi:unnamed protein product [Haemonchus placei]|uniref:Uncharacterized protein n=1 Tax=Haemonchus placei TaxID=6290 RepID=A0A0N4W3V1_HAEPC|nr:unnamed protein product [Haemonchus placei]
MKDKNPKCWKEYCAIIKEQHAKGFVEDIPTEPQTSSPIYYIPHQALIKSTSATTETGIVLDASSKMKG